MWLLTFAATLASFAIAAELYSQVITNGPISYAMGGWKPPVGIEYRIDQFNGLMLLLITAVAAVVLPFARTSVDREVDQQRHALFWSSWLLCFTGLLGIVITGDAFNVFVFLEVSSLSTYALIACSRDRRGLTSAFQYLIMGTIGATFILIGIGLLYVLTGTLNMADLAARLPEVSRAKTLETAFVFIVVGCSLKLALFPLHLWMPNAYAFAPSAVTAFIAATATKVAIYVMLRFFFTIFGADFSYQVMPLGEVLMVLAIIAMFSGSLVAIFEQNVKRMLAYSSVAQIGYIMLGVSLATTTGVAAGLLHILNHAIIKAALFMALGAVVYRLGSCRLEQMAGLGKQMPWTMAAFVAGGLSLIGVPLTTGFISKWYLVTAAFDAGMPLIPVAILGASLLAVIYIWKVVEAAYLRPRPQNSAAVSEAPVSLLLPLWLMVAANFYFGIQGNLLWERALAATQQLMGGS
ncbi:MAG: monovalent cation/H+ antiporter subunit D family protein [Gammaproteobacteria bacterium]